VTRQPSDDLELKEDVLAAVWAVVSPPWDDPDFRVTHSAYNWGQYGYLATYTAATVMLCGLNAYGTIDLREGHVGLVVAPEPPAEILSRIGTREEGLQLARATWDLVNGIFTSGQMGVNDPLIEDQLRAIDATYQGLALYMFAWWAYKAIDQIAERRDDPHLGDAAMMVYEPAREAIGLPPFEGDANDS
jgi:hypothetical protein